MIDDIDSNGTKADEKPKYIPAKPMGKSTSYAITSALNRIRVVHLAAATVYETVTSIKQLARTKELGIFDAATVHETVTPIKTIRIDTVYELEKHLANGTIEVKSAKFEGEGFVDTPTKLVVLDNANETQKDFMNDLTPMELASMYLGGTRNATLNTNAFLAMMLGAAASSGQGNHSVSNVLGRQRLMITSEERQRRKKLKKIAARDRKRNRK